MAIDITALLPDYVRTHYPVACALCGRTLVPVDFSLSLEEVERGETPYAITIVHAQCPCGVAHTTRYIDWNRTVPL